MWVVHTVARCSQVQTFVGATCVLADIGELPRILDDVELCSRAMVTELLWHFTLEVMCALGELLRRFHTGAVVHAS